MMTRTNADDVETVHAAPPKRRKSKPLPPAPAGAERWISVDEFRALIGVSRFTLWNLRKRGACPPAHRITENLIRFRLSEVEAWLNARPTA